MDGRLGRREPVAQPATSKEKEVALMKRIILLVTVALLMAVFTSEAHAQPPFGG